MLTAGDTSWLGRLPTELIDMISDRNDGTISRAEAEAYRLALMDERTALVERSGSIYFVQEFNMLCVLRFSRPLFEELAETIAKFSER